jgi:threonine/homoserine/homoserine lactone efflux protein
MPWMGIQDLWTFVAAVLVFLALPGPGTFTLLTATGRGGVRGGYTALFGLLLGDQILMWLAVAGVAALLKANPMVFHAVQYLGAAYLVWLAWKIATSGQAGTADAKGKPFGFWQAAAFQWVNPKAWLMSVGVVAAYTTPNSYWPSLLLGTLVMLVVNFPCISVWTLFGSVIGRWMQSPRALQVFNGVMAALLLLSLYPLLVPHG